MSNYRFALRAYPPTYRLDHGAEVVDTANELAAGSWSPRQSRSLIVGGLRARAREATNGSRRSVWASGARAALLVWMVIGVAPYLAFAIGGNTTLPDETARPLMIWALIPIAAMTVSTKWWVATLITAAQTWFLYANVTLYDTPWVFALGLLASTATVIAIAWWLALSTDGRRAGSPIATSALLTAATALFGLYGVEEAAIGILAVSTLLVLGGLIVSRIDPRLTTTGTILVGLFVVSTIPIALGNDDSGWGYWAPIGLSVLFLSVMVAASWSGIRRLASA